MFSQCLLSKDTIEYWIESAPKLWEARSRLYRSRFLQSNTRWKALAEIYKICIPLHRSDRKISAKNRPTFCEIEYWIFNIFALVQFDFAIFLWNFDEILSEFRDKSQKIMKIIEMLMKNAEKMRKFLENSGIAGKFQSGLWIFQSCPYVAPPDGRLTSGWRVNLGLT